MPGPAVDKPNPSLYNAIIIYSSYTHQGGFMLYKVFFTVFLTSFSFIAFCMQEELALLGFKAEQIIVQHKLKAKREELYRARYRLAEVIRRGQAILARYPSNTQI